MYQPYPGNAQTPRTQRQQPPTSVRTAVRVMYAGAVASLLGIVINLATLNATKDALRNRFPDLTADQLAAQQVPLILGGVAGGLIAAVLWIVISRACAHGQGWARITGTVLFAIATADAIGNLLVPEATAVKAWWWVIWLIGLATVVLLWLPASTRFFGGSQP